MKIDEMKNTGHEVHAKCGMVAKLFKTLSNPLRLSILCVLFDGEKTVGELEELTKGSQSQISQFLKRMEYEKLVSSRRDGKYTYYKLADENIYQLFETLNRIYR